jgi:hypothetical protein
MGGTVGAEVAVKKLQKIKRIKQIIKLDIYFKISFRKKVKNKTLILQKKI